MTAARRALIGHTGFVGSSLNVAGRFTDVYNSANSATMAGQAYDRIICAGVSAAKWIANGDPEGDWAAIARLIQVLERTEAEQFVLISTIDVYPDPASGGDEATIIDGEKNHAYGRNRLRLESWAAAHFTNCRIVRLPALYGAGLRKNALYDLLHDNQVDRINPAGLFQWYPMDRLWTDIGRAIEADLRLVNLFTEPTPMSAIIEDCFPGVRVGQPKHPAPAYRVQTNHAALFGGRDGYIMSADSVLDGIARFVGRERGRAP